MLFTWLLLHASSFASEPIESGAEVSATARVGLQGCIESAQACAWVHFRDSAVVSPWLHAKPSQQVRAKAALDVRMHGPGQGFGIESTAEQQAWSVRINDIWVATHGNHVQVQVGTFRTAWGVASGVSVVDTINPLDLENPTKFDQRLSVPTAAITAHSETFSVSGIVIPFFVPAALPNIPNGLLGSTGDTFSEQLDITGDTHIGSLESRPKEPDNTLANTTLGFQLRWTPPVGDFALTWHHGRDSLPQVDGELLLVGYQTNSQKVDVGLPLAYPKMDVFGFTARAPIGGEVTGWAETAVTLPEYTSASPSAAQLDGLVKLGTIESVPDPVPSTVTQDGKPMVKSIIGIERPFGPVRLFGQWMHGFFTERSQAELQHYGLLGVQWTLGDTVRLDANGASNLSGHLAHLSLHYLVDDTIEIEVGGTHFDGNYNSTFRGLRDASNLFTRVSMKF